MGVGDCSFPYFDSTSIFCCQILECVAKCFLIGLLDFFLRNANRMVLCANKNLVSSVIGVYLLLLRLWGKVCLEFCRGVVKYAFAGVWCTIRTRTAFEIKALSFRCSVFDDCSVCHTFWDHVTYDARGMRWFWRKIEIKINCFLLRSSFYFMVFIDRDNNI